MVKTCAMLLSLCVHRPLVPVIFCMWMFSCNEPTKFFRHWENDVKANETPAETQDDCYWLNQKYQTLLANYSKLVDQNRILVSKICDLGGNPGTSCP